MVWSFSSLLCSIILFLFFLPTSVHVVDFTICTAHFSLLSFSIDDIATNGNAVSTGSSFGSSTVGGGTWPPVCISSVHSCSNSASCLPLKC